MTFTCYRHPDREAPFYCQKDAKYMCRDCARCHSPRIYCQFRTACVIELLTKEGELPGVEEEEGRAEAPSRLPERTRTHLSQEKNPPTG